MMEIERNKEGGRDRAIEEGRERVSKGSQRGRQIKEKEIGRWMKREVGVGEGTREGE